MVRVIVVPDSLQARRRSAPEWAAWLDELPRRAAALCEEWQVRPDGEPWHGHASMVLPVLTRAGAPAALKLGMDTDVDAAQEHLALTRWAGRGVVDLLRADPRRRALLLERLDTRDLSDEWDIAACELVASRYPDLHVPAGPAFDLLSDRLAVWEPGLRGMLKGAPVPRRMVEHALSLVKSLRTDPATDGTLVHTDLHYRNVLATRNGDAWVVIDPKPLSGDPHHEVAPLLVNRFEELAGDVRGGVRRRFEAVVDAAGFDEDRARDWVVVRMLVNISWTLEEVGPGGPTAHDKEWITRCLTVAKAVQ